MKASSQATIRDVARKAGVTDTTVSLAFQPESRVSSETRKRVLAIARKLGYVPNANARQLRRGHSRVKTLGLLVPDITNPFYALVFEAVVEAARAQGFEVFVRDSRWRADDEVAAIQGLIEARMDGVLCFFSEKTTASLELLERFSVPYVALDTYVEDYTGPYVFNDLDAAARLAAEHLADVGCRKIVFVNAEKEMAAFSAFRILQRAFRRTLARRSIPLSFEDVIYGGLSIAAGEQCYPAVKARNPDGIFCGNSLCALGLLDAADRDGVRIGRDVALVGVDDLEVCRVARIGLTSIRQPYTELARRGTLALIEAIQSGGVPRIQQALEPELIVRASSRLQ